MSDHINPPAGASPTVRAIGRISFFVSLIGAMALLIATLATNLTPIGMAQRVLSWVAVSGLVAMLGGIVIYIVHVGFVLYQNRNVNTGDQHQ
ncbi:MAG: hypothetical protein AAFV33_06785 [Chloroflexota bacterium]